MTLLRYSRGRGRAPPGGGSNRFNFTSRGRGGRSGIVRNRSSMTWTNGAIQHGRNQPYQSNPPPGGTAVPRDPAPKTGVNRVWINTTARGRGGRNYTQNTEVGGRTSYARTSSGVSNGSGICQDGLLQEENGRGSGSVAATRPVASKSKSSVSATVSIPRTWSSNAITSKAGNRVWVNNGNNHGDKPQASRLGGSVNLSQAPIREATPMTQPPCLIPGRELEEGVEVTSRRSNKSGNLVWMNAGAGGAAPAAKASAPRAPTASATRCTIAPSSSVSTPTAKPVSRYSVSVNWRLNSDGSAAKGGEYSKRTTAGQVARYSGVRGGRATIPGGRGVVAWRGAKRTSRGDNWTRSTGRGLSSWRGRQARGYYVGRRGFKHPSSEGRMGYIPRLSFASRFAYPAPRWAASRNPGTLHGTWGGWRRSISGVNRPRRTPVARARFKNRSLIRIRGVILRQPVAKAVPLSGAAPNAAAARRAAIARRCFIRSAHFPMKSKNETPTNFVRSGKHGMTIWRVGSSNPATSRVGAAIPANTLDAAASFLAAEASRQREKKPPPPSTKNGFLVAPRVSKPSPSATSTSSLPIKTIALLSKSRARTVASSRAAAVVAVARAKNTRVRVRNMTLYRGKGEVAVIKSASGGVGSRGSEKRVKAKREPCLFFSKYGKCSKSDDSCPYAHDKTKVAVCRAFLKGNCDDGDECLLTHAVQTEKMPACVFFERGMCFTPNCPYRHVKVSRNAAVCPNFLKGYCPDGVACRLKHVEYDRKRRREADSGDHQSDDEAANAESRKADEARSKTTAAAGAASVTVASATPPQGKSGECIGLRGASVGKSRYQESRASDVRGDPSRKAVGASAETSNGEGASQKHRETITSDKDEELEEDDLKPKFLWKRRK